MTDPPGLHAVIICPLAHEAKAIRRRLRRLGVSARVTTCGPGPDAVRCHVEDLVRRGGPALLILAGVAGSLAPCVTAPPISTVIDERGTRWPVPGAPAGGAVILGVDAPVLTPAEKRAAHDRTGALLVDTESHAFAAVCTSLGVRWAVARAVSDAADETLPTEVVRWIAPNGRTRVARVALDVLRRPALVPALVRLGRRSAAAMPHLAERIAEMIRAPVAKHEGMAGQPSAPIMPMPVPPGAPLVVLIGGTFDPPHRAHVELPVRAREALEREAGCPGAGRLVYVPAVRSPHKATGPVACDAERVEMLRLALLGTERAGVWMDEIDRAIPGSPSYTVDTLRRARSWLDENGGAGSRMRLLIGADQALEFHRWREPRVVIELAEPAVMLRSPITSKGALVEAMRARGGWSDEELRQWAARVLDVAVCDAAATSARELLAAPVASEEELKRLLDERVLDYIRSHRLYASVDSPPGAGRPLHPAQG